MGRRVTSSTKGGRFMNPADQERKMARKKELKKNKKQRHMVRQAVLKSKDPEDLLIQMEKLDEIEFSDMDEKPLTERVMLEKRTKLRETYVRVMSMYKRDEEMEKFTELKRLLQAYDEKRTRLHQQFVAQKFAREADPADIPLPDAAPPPPEAAAAMTPVAALANRHLHHHLLQPFPSHMMLPDFAPFNASSSSFPGVDGAQMMMRRDGGAEHLQSILKKTKKRSTFPPGPPVGLPPDLSGSSDEEVEEQEPRGQRRDQVVVGDGGDEEDEDTDASSRPSRVRFDQSTTAADGSDAADEKDSRTKYKELAKKIERGEIPAAAAMTGEQPSRLPSLMMQGGGRPGAAIPPPPSLMPPHHHMNQLAMGRLRPPGGMGMGGMGMPPPPPPGFPPPNRAPTLRPSFVGHVPGATSAVAAVLSAPPALNKQDPASSGAVIVAKPQLRNMQQEITKLVPTAVKLRREAASAAQAQKKPKGPLIFRTPETKVSVPGSSIQHAPQKSTDEAYDQFMKEIQSII